MIRLPDASAFEVDWESLAACFRQFTNTPADTRHADVAPALRFISRNMIEPLDVAAVVAAMPVGRRTLERRFETLLGVSVRRAITLVRLEIARQLLGRTSLTITEISVEVGFSSSSQMSNVFHRVLGLSPREIRGVRSNGAAKTPASGVYAAQPSSFIIVVSGELPADFVAPGEVWRGIVAPGEVIDARSEATSSPLS